MAFFRIKAWAELHSQLDFITHSSYINPEECLERDHLKAELENLYQTELTAAQITSISEAIYYAYQLGKKESKS